MAALLWDRKTTSSRTFRRIVCEHCERGHLVGDAVAQTRTVRSDTGTAGMVHIELKGRLWNTQNRSIKTTVELFQEPSAQILTSTFKGNFQFFIAQLFQLCINTLWKVFFCFYMIYIKKLFFQVWCGSLISTPHDQLSACLHTQKVSKNWATLCNSDCNLWLRKRQLNDAH